MVRRHIVAFLGAAILTLGLVAQVPAEGLFIDGKVTLIFPNSNPAGDVLFMLEVTSGIACVSPGFWVILDGTKPSIDRWYGIVMTSLLTGKTVRLGISDTECGPNKHVKASYVMLRRT